MLGTLYIFNCDPHILFEIIKQNIFMKISIIE